MGFYKGSRGAASRAFGAEGRDLPCTLIKGCMGEESEIDLIECQGGTYTCRQEVMVTRVCRDHLRPCFQELEASNLDFRHRQLLGDRSTPRN